MLAPALLCRTDSILNLAVFVENFHCWRLLDYSPIREYDP